MHLEDNSLGYGDMLRIVNSALSECQLSLRTSPQGPLSCLWVHQNNAIIRLTLRTSTRITDAVMSMTPFRVAEVLQLDLFPSKNTNISIYYRPYLQTLAPRVNNHQVL